MFDSERLRSAFRVSAALLLVLFVLRLLERQGRFTGSHGIIMQVDGCFSLH